MKESFALNEMAQLARDPQRFTLAKANIEKTENTATIDDIIPQENNLVGI